MKQKDTWPYLDFLVEAPGGEVCQNICWENGAIGILEDTPRIGAFRVYYSNPNQLNATLSGIANSSFLTPPIILNQGNVTDPGWRTAWHQYFKPAPVGKRFIILPSWEKQQCTHKIPLIIDPGQAFGTGQHETTHLCIRMLESLELENKKVYDAGSGSGVLGIAAIKLGAASVLGRDQEEEAVAEAEVNSGLNNTAEHTEWICGDVTDEKGFYDLLIGNINTIFLRAHANDLIQRVVPNGFMIISGFLQDDRDEIEQCFTGTSQCELLRRDSMKQWASALFRRV